MFGSDIALQVLNDKVEIDKIAKTYKVHRIEVLRALRRVAYPNQNHPGSRKLEIIYGDEDTIYIRQIK